MPSSPVEPEENIGIPTHSQPRHRVLLIDDQLIVAAALRRMLEDAPDIEFHAVQDPQQAFDAALSIKPSVILQDLVMPGADGLELVRRFRAHAETSHIPVIVLSVKEDPQIKANAFASGANDYLIKLPAKVEILARLRYHASAYQNFRQKDAAYAQLSRELAMAKKMLLGLLPEPGVLGKANFQWLFQASSYVSGDCFDYFPLNDRYLCFYVVDVSGHGVSAAMLAFNAQHQIRASDRLVSALINQNCGDIGKVAAAVVAEFNSRFMQMRETSLYLTMLYGILDQETGKVALVQAGHPPAWYFAGGRSEPVSIGEGSLPIGFLNGARYEAHILSLAAGARLYLYSDGITDCLNAEEEAFGQERLRQLLTQTQTQPLDQVGHALHDALRAWQGGADHFADDVTFLAVEFGR